MATLTQNELSLLELANRTNIAGPIIIAEVFDQVLDLRDVQWFPANNSTSHRISRRTREPAGAYRKIAGFTTPESSRTELIDEPLSILEAYSEVDVQLAKMSGNINQFRGSEDRSFISGMAKTHSTTLFFGDHSTNIEEFDGFATRTPFRDQANVQDAGGTNDGTLSSIFVVQWGLRKVHMAFPQDGNIGLEMRDLKEQTADDGSGNLRQVFRTVFTMTAGLVVHDFNSLQRVANIETVTTPSFPDDDLLTALNELPENGRSAVIYMNKTVKTLLDIAAKDKTNVNYVESNAFGSGLPDTFFRGIPVRVVESILDTEARLPTG